MSAVEEPKYRKGSKEVQEGEGMGLLMVMKLSRHESTSNQNRQSREAETSDALKTASQAQKASKSGSYHCASGTYVSGRRDQNHQR